MHIRSLVGVHTSCKEKMTRSQGNCSYIFLLSTLAVTKNDPMLKLWTRFRCQCQQFGNNERIDMLLTSTNGFNFNKVSIH